MAVTITRTAWIDDDGSGTTGTVINNAVKTSIYNEIDGALAKVAQLTGGNTFTGDQSITGVLTVNGYVQYFIGTTAADTAATFRNLSTGPTARASVLVGNDALAYATVLLTTGSGYVGAGTAFPGSAPNATEVQAWGSGGLALVTIGASPLRLATGALERMRITATGEVLVNLTAPVPALPARVQVGTDQSAQWGVLIQATVNAPNGYFVAFANQAGAVQGNITAATSTTVAYNTTSDVRLKEDAGRASDLAALRAIVVHDFRWKADGGRDRGIFAQEAHALYPRAVAKGTDETTEAGHLARPWMTDYSKFVPDLIVGWQQHDAELAALRATLATLKGPTDAHQ